MKGYRWAQLKLTRCKSTPHSDVSPACWCFIAVRLLASPWPSSALNVRNPQLSSNACDTNAVLQHCVTMESALKAAGRFSVMLSTPGESMLSCSVLSWAFIT